MADCHTDQLAKFLRMPAGQMDQSQEPQFKVVVHLRGDNAKPEKFVYRDAHGKEHVAEVNEGSTVRALAVVLSMFRRLDSSSCFRVSRTGHAMQGSQKKQVKKGSDIVILVLNAVQDSKRSQNFPGQIYQLRDFLALFLSPTKKGRKDYVELDLGKLQPADVCIKWDGIIRTDSKVLEELAQRIATNAKPPWELADYNFHGPETAHHVPTATNLRSHSAEQAPESSAQMRLSDDDRRIIRMPFLPLGDKFKGRRKLIETLTTELTDGRTSVISQPSALYSDGGIGKTALAIELGYRLHDAKAFAFVFFLDASTSKTLDAELASLCGRECLNLPEHAAPEQDYRRGSVLAWLGVSENGKRTVLILDNADSDEVRAAVRRLLASVRSCAVLVTSRHSVWEGAHTHKLDFFTPEESREYLLSRLDQQASAPSDAIVDGIAEAVDHLPLALEVVTSYMLETRQGAAEWLAEWRSSPAPTLTFHDSDHLRYPLSLYQVWDQSVSRLSPLAREILAVLAFVAPRPALLPLKPFEEGGSWIGQRSHFVELAKASLITWPQGTNFVSIHRVLQAVTRLRLDEMGTASALHTVLKLIDSAVPEPDWSESGWRLWQELEPHIQAVLVVIDSPASKRAAARLMNRYGEWLFLQGNLAEAERLHSEAIRIYEEEPGSDNVQFAQALHDLGQVLFATARHCDSALLHRRALRVLENHHGIDSPELLDSLNQLIGTLIGLDCFDESEELKRRFVNLFDRHLTTDDPRMPRFLNNLAVWEMASSGTTNEVRIEKLLRQANQLDAQWPDRDVYQAALRLAGFAEHLRWSRRESEAEPIARSALDTIVSIVGPQHNRSAFCMHVLARILRDLSKTDEAAKLFRQSLTIREKTYGPDHLDILQDLLQLAGIALEGSQLTKAKHLCGRALRIHFLHRLRNKLPLWSESPVFGVSTAVFAKMNRSGKSLTKWLSGVLRKVTQEVGNTGRAQSDAR